MSACPACSGENPDVARFCIHCGASLTAVCPSCGATAPPGARFCMQCGSALATTTEEPSPAALAAAGEKKHITVLFADVAGSMDLQEQLDPEVWAQIMGRFVAILAEGVRTYGGTVDKFTGDGIMALFGAPVAQEDHARRACHAAWHLTRAIGKYSEELRGEQGVELDVRLGLNSGEVVVGRVGNDVTLDPTALGHAVGLAQRMEAMAAPGTAYLSGHTARLVEGWFQIDDLGIQPVKGSREQLQVYALGGPSPSAPVLHGGGSVAAPLVGRDRELAALDDALAMAMEGRAQVVGVVGEAGVGKSRLCDDFARACRSRGVTVWRTTGISHAQDVPLLPVLAFLRDYFSIVATDDTVEARRKISRRLLDLDPRLDESLPVVFDFLEVADPARPVPILAPEVRMRRIFETLRRVTQRRSERETLVLVFEDLHWFDPQSRAFLDRLIPSFPGTRTMVVTNFRPEFIPPWSSHSYYRQVPLAPLDVAGARRLLGGLLGQDPSLVPLIDVVVERTGGNPFFIEEVVRSVAEDATLVGDPGAYRLSRPLGELRVPPTIQATLAARVDRLDDTDRGVLRTAAVIGRSFTTAVLQLLVGGPYDNMTESLRRLCSAEFLQEVADRPGQEYRFWHPLTQDVAYLGLLREQRIRLHGAAARAIIATEPDRLEERAALIASHFKQAGEPLEAARWNERAGGFALRTDVGEAMRRWRATLVHLDSAPETEEPAELGIRVRNRLIRYGARTGMDLDEAAQLYTEAKNLAEHLHDATQLASVTFAYASTLFFRGAVADARDRYFEAADLADEGSDADAQAGYSVLRLVPCAWTGPVSEGLAASERVATLCGGNPDIGASVLGFSPLSLLGPMRAQFLFFSGQVDEACAELERSLAVARHRGESEWIAWGLSIFARLARTPEKFARGLGQAHEALRVSEDSGNRSTRVLAMEAVGIAQAGLMRYDEAADVLAKALAEARERQVALFDEARLLVYLAVAHLGMGNPREARQAADEAVEVARRQGARLVECLALTNRARVWLATQGPDEQVLADLGAGLELTNETEAISYEPLIREQLGRLLNDEAELTGALRLYRQFGATDDAHRVEAELAARSVR